MQRRIIRLPEVKRISGLGRTKIYELMKMGRFPKCINIAGGHTVGWDSIAIDAWVAEQLDQPS